MPLARYFLFVGGVLLALLFVSGWMLPKLPMAESADLGVERSFLKINSGRKWPERIVFDPSIPTVVPAQIATAEDTVAPPATDAAADDSAKERDAFAQLEPSDQKKPQPKPHPETQNCEEAPCAVKGIGRPTAAVWFFRQQHLVGQTASVPELPVHAATGFHNG
jgi:hypothetical protein